MFNYIINLKKNEEEKQICTKNETMQNYIFAIEE